MSVWSVVRNAWERCQLALFRVVLRLADLVVLLPKPRLLWVYLRLFVIELRHSPYRWPRSFEATLARQKSNQSVRELVYGETPVVTGLWLFRRAGIGPESRLLDLGAGRGRALIAARWLGARVRGLELLAEHVRLVSGVLSSAGIEMETGDAAEADLSDVTHVYLAWTGLNQATRDRIEARLCARAMAGTRVIAVDCPVEDESFVTVSRHDVLFPWGPVPVWVQEKNQCALRDAELADDLDHVS